MKGAACERWAWPAACGIAAAGSLMAMAVPREWLEWQPGLATQQPWRAVTAALAHWSPRHLAMNLAGCALLALLGYRASVGQRSVLAWALAWPLTQLGLLAWPDLRHYAGLSGELHAAAAIVACELLARAGDRRNWRIGVLLATGLLIKLVLEAPWGAPTQSVPGWDFELAPAAHATGAVAGLLAWAVVAGRGAR